MGLPVTVELIGQLLGIESVPLLEMRVSMNQNGRCWPALTL
jgi:hypothetical protein